VSVLNFDRYRIVAQFLEVLRPARPRRDLAPDYLGLASRSCFERDGFCFTVSLDREDRAATFTIMYQNRFAGRAVAGIAMRPVGSSLAVYSPYIQCGPAGFGVAKFPAAVPSRHQGKFVTFEIGADVDYPDGRGREVRFRDGWPVHHNAQFDRLPAVPRALPGRLIECILIKAATVRLMLPIGAVEELPDDETGHAEELWKLSVPR
jgi:hypothetical protein